MHRSDGVDDAIARRFDLIPTSLPKPAKSEMADRALRDAIEDVGLLVDEAAFDIGRWQDVADAFARSFPGSRASLQVIDPALGRAAPMVVSGWDAGQIDAYARYYGTINPWIPLLMRASALATICSEEEIPSSELRKSEFYQDWLRPIGEVDASTGIKLLDCGGRFGALTLSYDARCVDRLNPGMTRMLAALAPRFERSLNIARVGIRDAWHGESTSLLNAMADPALIVSCDGRLLDANAAAAELVGSGAAFRLGAGDRIRFDDPYLTRSFGDGLRAACLGRPRPEQTGGLQFATPAGRFAVTMMGLRPELTRARGLAAWLAAGQIALVVMQPCAEQRGGAAQLLAGRYRLSPAEARLALAMDGKRALPAVAADLGVTHETARWHLKRIFAKLGVSRQGELVALLAELKGA